MLISSKMAILVYHLGKEMAEKECQNVLCDTVGVQFWESISSQFCPLYGPQYGLT